MPECAEELRLVGVAQAELTGALGTIEIPWKPYTPAEEPSDKPKTGLLHEASFITLEVVDTGEKFRVVIFPSTVMAKVAATNGRRSRRLLLFRFADLMLQRRDFPFHLPQLYVY